MHILCILYNCTYTSFTCSCIQGALQLQAGWLGEFQECQMTAAAAVNSYFCIDIFLSIKFVLFVLMSGQSTIIFASIIFSQKCTVCIAVAGEWVSFNQKQFPADLRFCNCSRNFPHALRLLCFNQSLYSLHWCGWLLWVVSELLFVFLNKMYSFQLCIDARSANSYLFTSSIFSTIICTWCTFWTVCTICTVWGWWAEWVSATGRAY